MAVTARGLFGTPPATLRTMLGTCTAWQKLCQAADASEALDHIHLFERNTSRDGSITRPFAVVLPPHYKFQDVGDGASLSYAGVGTLALHFEMAISTTGTLTGVTSAQILVDSALVGLADDHFNGMRLKMTSGAYKGDSAPIADFDGATGTITLAAPLAGAPAIADTCRIEAPSTSDAYLFALNTLGDVVADLKLESGKGGSLALRDINLEIHGLSKPDKKSRLSEYYLAQVSMGYGR